ncbi:GTP cyclohydrolase FolE2 [Desulfotalea psychrophila]|uniref:GTP cyclohydrolase FolE2 n=1 Tax=Desulfotalea psychrophila (strain LSv54 / DSM 12343) TaxID=177439 RepID=GCH4_DESPS|nr:GTP cyclohydrolase FolE2 [Desulfotalea psychrophila]Q6AMT5.1 RecName: Full=GTP cyclohydrolase FolE2 [Desulfotalea psychrophila LSv54]CAG36340.1 conserved hypothetical protein [Desulfotalea psychrophila LSv54]
MSKKQSTICQKVGIADLEIPIILGQKDGKLQHSIASCKITATIKETLKGDISGEVQRLLPSFTKEIEPKSWHRLLEEFKENIGVEKITLSLSCPFFVSKKAPVSELRGLMEYNCTFSASTGESGITTSLYVPVTTLCPCSKEISDGGAHNQRAEAIFRVEMKEHLWLEDLIQLVEESASCQVYSVLKRPDEKYVTEKAFDNPMFVEDVVRKIAVRAGEHPLIHAFSISVESFESIHKHNAYAYVNSEDLNL